MTPNFVTSVTLWVKTLWSLSVKPACWGHDVLVVAWTWWRGPGGVVMVVWPWWCGHGGVALVAWSWWRGPGKATWLCPVPAPPPAQSLLGVMVPQGHGVLRGLWLEIQMKKYLETADHRRLFKQAPCFRGLSTMGNQVTWFSNWSMFLVFSILSLFLSSESVSFHVS